MLKKILICSSIALYAVASHAQELPVRPDMRDDDDSVHAKPSKDTTIIRELQPIEVRSVRATGNSPFAHSNLDRQEISKRNLGTDLPVLLQFTPSAVTTSDAGAGVGYTGLRIRGTDPTRINVTFNGMPVNDPEEQAAFFVDIPDIASSTSSIQVQRGVGTSTNGAGAFGATISINNLQQMDTAGIMLAGSYGSFNTVKNTLVAGSGMLKGGFQFDVRLSRITSDGYIQRSASDLKSMQLTAGWTPNDKTSFHFLFMPGMEKTGQAWDGVPQDSLATNRRYNELGQKADGTYYNNQTDNYQQNYYQLFADHRFSNTLVLHTGVFLTRGKGYYEEYKTGEAFASYGLPDIVSASGADTTTNTDLIRRLWLDNYYYGGVFALNYVKSRTLITLGGGWNQFENLGYGNVIWSLNGGVPDNYKWYQVDAQKNDLNIYLKAQHTIGHITFTGDIQYRNVAYFMNGFRDNPAERINTNYNFYNPKAGISYLISSNKLRNRAYMSFAIGNKEPGRSAFESDFNRVPKPERLYDWELGNELSIGKLALAANVYYMQYKDQLVLTGQLNDVGASILTNVDNSYRAGIELMGAYNFCRAFNLYGNLTLSQNKINSFTEYVYDYDNLANIPYNHSNTNISFSPGVVGALTASFTPFSKPLHSLSIDITGKYVGKQYLDNTSNADRSIDAYKFVNVLVRYTMHTKTFKELTATLVLNNIFNSYYETNGATYTYMYNGSPAALNYYFPQAGFNVMGGVSMRL